MDGTDGMDGTNGTDGTIGMDFHIHTKLPPTALVENNTTLAMHYHFVMEGFSPISTCRISLIRNYSFEYSLI